MKQLVKHIHLLAGIHDPQVPLKGTKLNILPVLQNAFLTIEDDIITGFGPMDEAPSAIGYELINAQGGSILPAWCDSHTHLVFAQGRENEFVDKIRGLSYEEIAARGGGILNSAKAINEIDEDLLFDLSLARLNDAMQYGTGAIEIKSGYGLNTEAELKMLRVIKRLRESSPMIIRSTFLGAHSFPEVYKHNRRGYIDLLKNEMIPMVGEQGLAEFIDVFCERGFFSPEETIEICEKGKEFGLIPKIHANQLHASGGVQAGIQLNALSVDHLESMDDAAIDALSHSDTIGTLLPSAAFFLRMPYQPARALIDRGCSIALASDFNPGSSPGFNMNFIVALACIQMKMLPEEAINAATINGAFAMDVAKLTGSITIGKKANIILTKPINSMASIPYHFSSSLIKNVMIGGNWIY